MLQAGLSAVLSETGFDAEAPQMNRFGLMYDDLGHVALLGSRRVAADVIQRLALR